LRIIGCNFNENYSGDELKGSNADSEENLHHQLAVLQYYTHHNYAM